MRRSMSGAAAGDASSGITTVLEAIEEPQLREDFSSSSGAESQTDSTGSSGEEASARPTRDNAARPRSQDPAPLHLDATGSVTRQVGEKRPYLYAIICSTLL
ncbi:hypothetical protein FJT64_000709 [Amphibalanus amphitrite]|uniref:Uncharacterized protein n=1 Tax=Amphibalanus amphitrite TaxID=1232801 RepID=A0A6A4VK42_AMPAM|nr:hypothetical protein FJT64_000709 [Amphibalanus amphitrite]